MKKIYFDGITEMGSSIKDAMVILPEDYTMNQLVSEIKALGYKMFKLNTMKVYAEVI